MPLSMIEPEANSDWQRWLTLVKKESCERVLDPILIETTYVLDMGGENVYFGFIHN